MLKRGGRRASGGKSAESAGFLKKTDPSEGVGDTGRTGEGDRGVGACVRRSGMPDCGVSGTCGHKTDRGGKPESGGIGADRRDDSCA